MAVEKENDDVLLKAYRLIWNNRLLVTNGKDSLAILIDAIKRELLDENSHPRARKSRYEKYYSAVNRVMKSTVSTESKFLLIELHSQIMEELSEEGK